MADRVRLFAEVLASVAEDPRTVEDVDSMIRERFDQAWRSKGNTRSRMDWQEVLGLIEPVGSRRWAITECGRTLLDGRLLVTPDAFDDEPEGAATLPKAPPEIAELLNELRGLARTQESRSTYNIWVPSPASKPNKVENLRTIVNAATERISKEDFFAFICSTFDLRRSSVDSMLPFMRAAGIVAEVGRGVFQATPPAIAWIDSGDDINFIRIMHANMRFVGEMIRAVEHDVTRSEMYAEAAHYGLNIDRCRWIASFLLNTALIEEPRYGSLRATSRGLALMAELPLADVPVTSSPAVVGAVADGDNVVASSPGLTDRLVRSSQDPLGGGENSGRAFELAVRDVFLAAGFRARLISGSGDTDVLVQWDSQDGSPTCAVVEAKARSSGHVAHSDVSDLAIETHKGRNKAEFVAIVGPAFSGDTIRNMASQKHWALIEAERLGALVEASVKLGLRPYEVGKLFEVPNGLEELEGAISAHQRELDIVTFTLSKLVEELTESGDAVSARDISRDGRRTELRPSEDEIVSAVDTLSRLQADALRLVGKTDDPKFRTYVLGDAAASAAQLRALADAIVRGLRPNATR